MIVTNAHDGRYRFELTTDGVAVRVVQLGTPPGTPQVWLPTVWAQWCRSATTRVRSRQVIERLRSERPTTKWFQDKVAWAYPV